MIRDLDTDLPPHVRFDSAPTSPMTSQMADSSQIRRRLTGEEVWPRLGPERRRDTRVSVTLWMMEEAEDHICYRRTADLSAGGAYFDPSIPHPVGTRMRLRIPIPESNTVLHAEAEVMNLTEDGEGMGVRFLLFDADGREQLRRFLETLPD